MASMHTGAALFAPWWARGLKNVVDSSGLKEQVDPAINIS